MKIVVTGGAGFIGSHLVDALVAREHEVLVLDNLSTGHAEQVSPQARLEEHDLRHHDTSAVLKAFAPQAVVHQAAQVSVRLAVDDPVADAESNVLGTVRLLQAAAAAGVQSFLLASTGGAIYGEQDVFPAPESHPQRPTSPYGVSKKCAEAYLDYFGALGTMRTVALRYGNVYGPRQDPHGEAGVVAIFSSLMLQGQVPTINGDGLQTRDYVFVEDVVRANLAALEHQEARGAYNVGTGVETSVVTLAQELARHTGFAGKPVHGPAKQGEQRRSVLDVSRAGRELSWKPEVSLAEGLRRTAEWFADRSGR